MDGRGKILKGPNKNCMEETFIFIQMGLIAIHFRLCLGQLQIKFGLNIYLAYCFVLKVTDSSATILMLSNI